MTSNGQVTRDAFLSAIDVGPRTSSFEIEGLGTLNVQSVSTSERMDKLDLWVLDDEGKRIPKRAQNRALRILQLVARNPDGTPMFDGTDEEFDKLIESHASWLAMAAVRATNFQAGSDEDETKN